ncbi:hypothetical protein HNP40_003092 [Mycobacteroides chelonae]|nr:hypothetical protein [Mycobacteroides chelonae]
MDRNDFEEDARHSLTTSLYCNLIAANHDADRSQIGYEMASTLSTAAWNDVNVA